MSRWRRLLHFVFFNKKGDAVEVGAAQISVSWQHWPGEVCCIGPPAPRRSPGWPQAGAEDGEPTQRSAQPPCSHLYMRACRRYSYSYTSIIGTATERSKKGTVLRDWIGPCIVLMDSFSEDMCRVDSQIFEWRLQFLIQIIVPSACLQKTGGFACNWRLARAKFAAVFLMNL
jgi:hypothetical protein